MLAALPHVSSKQTVGFYYKLEFKVSRHPKQYIHLMGNVRSRCIFQLIFFSFPLFPNHCVLSQAFCFVPLPKSGITKLTEEMRSLTVSLKTDFHA